MSGLCDYNRCFRERHVCTDVRDVLHERCHLPAGDPVVQIGERALNPGVAPGRRRSNHCSTKRARENGGANLGGCVLSVSLAPDMTFELSIETEPIARPASQLKAEVPGVPTFRPLFLRLKRKRIVWRRFG